MRTPVHNFKAEVYPKGDITQWFGENEALYQKHVIIKGVPLKGHNGIDIVRPHGEALYAIEKGTVIDVKSAPDGYGKHIRIVTETGNEWTYGHLSQILVKQNDVVEEGQIVGLMGNTGFVVSGATPFWDYNPYRGTHLHLGLRKVKIVKTGGWSYPGSTLRIKTLNYDNGYFGAVDPMTELMWAENAPTGDIIKTLQLTAVSLLNSLVNKLK